MNLAGAFIGGLIGGVIGAAIWIGVGFVSGYEIGWIAWGVGLLCGLGVYKGAGGRAGQPGGILAAVLALVSIVAAKYVLTDLTLRSMIQSASATTVADMPAVTDREFWITMMCEDIAAEKDQGGAAVNWDRAGMPPVTLWTEGTQRWDGLSGSEKAHYRSQSATTAATHMQDFLHELRGEMSGTGFFTTFGPIDLVFGVLAVVSAFKLGSMVPAKTNDPSARMAT